MKVIKNYGLKLFGICMGCLLLSCSSMNSEEVKSIDKSMIKKRMQEFLDKEIGKPFELKEFYATKSYQTNTQYYKGRYQSEMDSRIEIILAVSDDDHYTSIVNPENTINKYRRLVNTIAISDQTKKIVQPYFNPEFIHTYAKTEAENYITQLYIIDDINPEKIANYYKSVNSITSEIHRNVVEVEGHYFEVILNIFQNEFEYPKYENFNGAIDPNGPTGDYLIMANIEDDGTVKALSRIGFNSKLDNQYRDEIANKYQLKSRHNVIRDYHPHKDLFPEDVDQNGVRHFMRYFVPIYDSAQENVIRRDYLKLNIFTGDITPYVPK